MNWTNAKPDSPGYYWFRRDNADRPVLIEIDDEGNVFRFGEAATRRLSEVNGEFKGPIYP